MPATSFLEFTSIKLMEKIVRALHQHPDKGWSVKNWQLEDEAVRFDYMGDRYRVANVDGGVQVEWLGLSYGKPFEQYAPENKVLDMKRTLDASDRYPVKNFLTDMAQAPYTTDEVRPCVNSMQH